MIINNYGHGVIEALVDIYYKGVPFGMVLEDEARFDAGVGVIWK